MKTIGVRIVLSVLAMPSMAQEASKDGVTLGGSGPDTETCVEVEIAGQKTSGLDCLNQQIKRQVDHLLPTPTIAPLDAQSASVKVGGFSQAGMSEQYGKNFGKSVIPFRPAAPSFIQPLGAIH